MKIQKTTFNRKIISFLVFMLSVLALLVQTPSVSAQTGVGCTGTSTTNAIESTECINSIESGSTNIAAVNCVPPTTTSVAPSGEVFCRDTSGNYCSPSDQLFDQQGAGYCPYREPSLGPTDPEEPQNSNDPSNKDPVIDVDAAYIEPTQTAGKEDCSGVSIAIGVDCDDSQTNPIYAYATAIINFLAAGVGIVVIIMIVVGGIQYMMAGGNPQVTQAAVKRIIDALIGLGVFLFLYAFLQWVLPGGPF